MTTNPFEQVSAGVGNTITTLMAQGQAAIQNLMATAANMVQSFSSTIQRGQASLFGGVESMASNFVQTATLPLQPVTQLAQGLPSPFPPPMAPAPQQQQAPPPTPVGALTEGAQGGPGGSWLGYDTTPETPLRETEDYQPLTDNRWKYYDARYGGAGFTMSRKGGDISEGHPKPGAPIF